MLETSARLLRLLSLLSTRPFWTGDELATRLEVTSRTLRRDVTKLRSLGYPVDAAPGPAGGYQLGPGGTLPPLLLDDDEAVAVAVGLRTAASGTVLGLEDAAVAALAKVEQVLPVPLRHRVDALQWATVQMGRAPADIAPRLLVTVAQACRGFERLRFTYHDRRERASERTVEPFRLVHTGRRWYLVARDVRRDAWRTFRVDRIDDVVATGHRFTLDNPPDPVALVSEGLAVAPYEHRARVQVHASLAKVARVVPRTVAVLEPSGANACTMTIGADRLDWIARYLTSLPFDFEVVEPVELRQLIREIGERLAETHA